MKKQIIALAIIVAACFSSPLHAQVGLSVNIGVQPVWGPVGYDHVDYYYIPDIEAYYNVPMAQYTFFDHGRWITSPYLPPRYRDFDLYHSHKVVINEPNPWFHHDRYRGEYAHFRGMRDQGAIRDSHDQRYFENPGHPMHNQWHGGGHGDMHGHDEHRGEARHDEHRGEVRHEEHHEEHHAEHRDEDHR